MTAARDARALRRALGAFATGVTIVTTRDEQGGMVGLTCNSFGAVSLEPPLVQWSLRHASGLIDIFRRTDAFAVNVLHARQMDLSARFAARESTDRFSGLELREGALRQPLIGGCLAHYECRVFARHDVGDHLVLFGEVIDYVAEPDGEPLVFHAGNYARLAPAATTPPAPPAD